MAKKAVLRPVTKTSRVMIEDADLGLLIRIPVSLFLATGMFPEGPQKQMRVIQRDYSLKSVKKTLQISC